MKPTNLLARVPEVDKTILAVAVPAFFALVSEPAMLLVDTAIVGRLGVVPLAGLAAASTVLTTVVGLCIFLAYATTASVGRLHGAGRPAQANAAAMGGVWLAVLLGIVVGGVLVAASPVLVGALTGSESAAEAGSTYLRVAALSTPALLVSLAVTGALRGRLDLRTPLVVAVSTNGINAVLSVWLVHGLDVGIAGAAWGTLIAQSIGALWLLAALVGPSLRASAPSMPWRPDPRALWSATRDGGPLVVRTLTLQLALLLATAVAAQLGDVPLAAHQIATALVTLLAFALDAIAIAGQSLTGRALGAGDLELTHALTRRMLGWGVVTGAVAGLGLFALTPWVGGWFVDDVSVESTVRPALVIVAVLQPVSGVVFVLDGVLIGAGDGRYLAWAGLATLAAYAPCAIAVAWLDASFLWLWVAYGVFQLARLVTLWLRQRTDAWLIPG